MKRYLRIILLLLCTAFVFSCSDDDDNEILEPQFGSDKTVIVFFPYTINLYGYLNNNIQDIERAMLKREDNPNVIVYMNQSKKESCIFEIRKQGDVCVHDTLRMYKDKDNTSVEGLSSVFSEIKNLTPETKTYSMIIGCHGMGWIYGDDFYNAKMMYPRMFMDEYKENPVTRWIGVSGTMIDMDKFAAAMDRASLHTNLMLFDVCYMGNIESVYELRNSTDYIVASSIEIMSAGMPYENLWDDIADGSESAMDNICNKFYSYYKNSDQPYAAISTINCKNLDNLASVVREINSKYKFSESIREKLQRLDGYNPSLFFDMGRYIELICTDAELLQRYNETFNKVVIHKYNTDEYYTDISQGLRGRHDIKYSSGLTTSAPSRNILKDQGWSRTAWYKATH